MDIILLVFAAVLAIAGWTYLDWRGDIKELEKKWAEEDRLEGEGNGTR